MVSNPGVKNVMKRSIGRRATQYGFTFVDSVDFSFELYVFPNPTFKGGHLIHDIINLNIENCLKDMFSAFLLNIFMNLLFFVNVRFSIKIF